MPRAGSLRARLNAVLLLLLVGIWSAVGVRLTREFRPSESATLYEPAAEPQAAGRRPRTPYRADFRDPFAPPAGLFAPPEPAASLPPTPAPSGVPMPRLLGIVGETALLRDTLGVVHLVTSGDTVLGTRILTVGADSVRVVHDARRLALGL